MVSSFIASTQSESCTSQWISVTAHVLIYISPNCAANQLLIRLASKRATCPPKFTTILLTRPKMVKTTTTRLNLRRSINLSPLQNLSTFSHPPSESTMPPPPSAKKVSQHQLQQSMFQRRQASRPTTRCLFLEHMLVHCRARRFNHRVSILALLHSRDRHIPQTRQSRVGPLAPGYLNPRRDGNVHLAIRWSKSGFPGWMGREHQKKKMIILCYPNPRSSPTLNRYLGIQFVTFSFLYSHEYILSFSIGVFFFFFWGGQGFMFSVVPSRFCFVVH